MKYRDIIINITKVRPNITHISYDNITDIIIGTKDIEEKIKRKVDFHIELMNNKKTQKKRINSNLKFTLEALTEEFDPHYQYSDDFTYWSKHRRIENQTITIKKTLNNFLTKNLI